MDIFNMHPMKAWGKATNETIDMPKGGNRGSTYNRGPDIQVMEDISGRRAGQKIISFPENTQEEVTHLARVLKNQGISTVRVSGNETSLGILPENISMLERVTGKKVKSGFQKI